MHTFKSGEFIFNFNSDLSGDVNIRQIIDDPKHDGHGLVMGKMDVSGSALLAFVASYVRERRVSNLENMLGIETDKEVLGFK